MTPFDQYEKVDVYLVDETNNWQLLLQQNAEVSLGMLASRKDASMYPDNLPVNRTCRIVFISPDKPLDGTHRTVNSSDFLLIRTQQYVSGTPTPIPTNSVSPGISPTLTQSLSQTATATFTHAPGNSNESVLVPPGAVQPPAPSSPPPNNSFEQTSLSSLAVGLIVAGSVAIVIAAVAIAQVFRTRRRYMREHAHFRTLPEPSSPRNGSVGKGAAAAAAAAAAAGGATGSGFSGSERKSDFEGVAAAAAAAAAAGLAGSRNSSTTVRSNTAMIQGAHALSGYSTPEPIPTIVVPLEERRPSTLDQHRGAPSPLSSSSSVRDYPSQEYQQQQQQPPQQQPLPYQQQNSVRFHGAGSASSISLGGGGGGQRPSLEPVISAGDARLIADTFRKSLRRPRWEEEGVEVDDDDDDDDDDDGQDEARRAAKELLRKELSEQGLDVQKTGVQRRVTIQTRPLGPEPDAAL
ncbi:hypothetical protein DFQ27_008391 [Actinomortierella ambigua]|uniref:Uncharacterized protein n=1 Tax=Actinomortierella ambigua TaxID=1343610 RepID=A0A9P6QKN3_9FUNG|nr:hypothetical protein DFQ27_008391 [Actinomortierella ambigua]